MRTNRVYDNFYRITVTTADCITSEIVL